MNKYGYIYCTTDLKNGMKYIGQKKSDKFIPSYFGSGAILKCKLKSRPDTFRVDLIEWCSSKRELDQKEIDWIKAIGKWPVSYNLTNGGEGGNGGANKGIKKPPYTDEQRRNLSLAMTGKKRSEEAKRKDSESKKGNKNPMFGKPAHNSGKHWYNDGVKNVYDFECPNGFVAGILKRRVA